MNIALIAHDNKKELMARFCTAYVCFHDPGDSDYDQAITYLSRLCDQNTVPFATNAATAEVLVLALDRGDLDWRTIVNPVMKM